MSSDDGIKTRGDIQDALRKVEAAMWAEGDWSEAMDLLLELQSLFSDDPQMERRVGLTWYEGPIDETDPGEVP